MYTCNLVEIEYIICQTYALSFYPPKLCFRILIQFLESEFSFSADISTFNVMIYNSKICCIGILNTDLGSKLKLEFSVLRILKQNLGG